MAEAVDLWEEKGNVHVDLDELRMSPRQIYLAELAARHGGDGHYLDVGCGAGLMLKHLRTLQPAATMSIADAYESCLALTERRIGAVAGRYHLDEADFRPDEVIAAQFDVVILSHVLEHLRSPAEGIERLLKLVKPGGKLILAVPNLGRPEVAALSLLGKDYVNRGHAYGWDRSHWRNFLERICGVKVIEYGADVVTLLPGAAGRLVGRTIGRPLARILPGWSFSNVAVIEKPA